MNSKINSRLKEAFEYPGKKSLFYSCSSDGAGGDHADKSKRDWTPQQTLTVEPWHWHEHTLALAFGCRPVVDADENESATPFLSNPVDSAKIKIPDPMQGRTGQIIEEIEDLLLEEDDDLLIRLPIVHSPLRVAELLWRKDAFIDALNNHPPKIHDLLQKITEFTIAYVQEIQGILGDRLNPVSFPEIWSPPNGCFIADDVHSQLSPRMHSEFSVPYINKIVHACGPLHYHFDSLTSDYFNNVRQINNIRSLSWSATANDDSSLIIKEFSGDILLCPSIDADAHKTGDFSDEADLVASLLDSMLEITALYFSFSPDLLMKNDVMKKICDLFESKGYVVPGG